MNEGFATGAQRTQRSIDIRIYTRAQRSVDIRTTEQRRTIYARTYCDGQLALHPTFGEAGWTITHVATGLAILRTSEESRARALAGALEGFGDAWFAVENTKTSRVAFVSKLPAPLRDWLLSLIREQGERYA